MLPKNSSLLAERERLWYNERIITAVPAQKGKMMEMAKTWRDIPIRDIGPMLRSCGVGQEWQSFWKDISSVQNSRDSQDLSPKSALACLLTMSMVVSTPPEDRKDDLEKFTNSFSRSDKENILEYAFPLRASVEDIKNHYYYHIMWLNKKAKSKSDPLVEAPPCYSEMLSFSKALDKAQTDVSKMTLGKLADKWNDADQQRSIEVRSMESTLDQFSRSKWNGAFYKIWYDWLLYKEIQAISAGKDALDHLEHGVKQIIFNGAPGTGKSYVSELLARCLGAALPGEAEPYVRVQFHPSYDYTDFVEGLRPVQINGKNEFVKLDGTFKAFCRQVDENGSSAENYFFLIDEINRADLSKVFGELMYCLEADKRGEEHKIDTQYQNLPTYDLEEGRELTKEEDVFAEGFYIPENVYIIGTMNDIDRSVESMDFALRRRFEFMELKVTKNTLRPAFEAMGFEKEIAEELAGNVEALNKKIEGCRDLSRDYFISQGQFANLSEIVDRSNIPAVKKYVWKYRIEPLLREYLRGEDEKAIDEFIKGCKDAFFDPANSKPGAQQTGGAQ